MRGDVSSDVSSEPPGRGLRGQEARDAWKAARSRLSAATRRGRVRRAPRHAGPGMIRRMPENDGNDAA
jgi:hypothetical protein